MNIKKALIFALVITMLAMSVGVVSAQEGSRDGDGGPRGDRGNPVVRNAVSTVAEATGLTVREVTQEVRNGSTLAEVVTSNGGDVAAITTTIITEATTNIEEALASDRITDEQANRLLENLDANVNDVLNGELNAQPPRGDRDGIRERFLPNVVQVVAEATGLTAQEIAQAVRDGETLAEIISAAGGDVDAVIAVSVAAITERVNTAVENGNMDEDRAAELIANAEQLVTDLLNGELRDRLGDGPRGEQIGQNIGRMVLQAAVEAIGGEPGAIREALQNGATLGSLLVEAGVDVDAFTAEVTTRFEERVNQAVENGNMDEDRAAELIDRFGERLEAILSGSRV